MLTSPSPNSSKPLSRDSRTFQQPLTPIDAIPNAFTPPIARQSFALDARLYSIAVRGLWEPRTILWSGPVVRVPPYTGLHVT